MPGDVVGGRRSIRELGELARQEIAALQDTAERLRRRMRHRHIPHLGKPVMAVRDVRFDPFEHDLPESRFNRRSPLRAVLADCVLKDVDFSGAEFEGAFAWPAVLDVIEVARLDGQRVEVLEAHWSRDAPDRLDVRGLFQHLDTANPRDEPVAADLHRDRREHRDVVILGRHDACDVAAAVQPLSLVRIQRDRWFEERKRIDRAALKERGLNDQQGEQAATHRSRGQAPSLAVCPCSISSIGPSYAAKDIANPGPAECS